KLKHVIYGWVNYFKIANMKSILTNIDAKLRSRIRVIIWKQWKSNKSRIKSLIQLGIPKEEAKGLKYCRKGYRFIVISIVVHRALSNKRLKQRGIPFALDYYLEVHTEISIEPPYTEPYVRWCDRDAKYCNLPLYATLNMHAINLVIASLIEYA